MSTIESEAEADQEPARPVALVTGGGRGIGAAVVRALLAEGYRVHFCARTPHSVDSIVRTLREEWLGRLEGQVIDIRRQDEVDDWVDNVLVQSGRIDCLVNNAGIGYFEPVEELPGHRWREVLETNLHGAFYCLHAAASVMIEQGSGDVFNIVSLAGRHAFAGGAAYNASKFGLLGLSDAAMLDLRPHGIRVCAILPGSVDTEFHVDSGRGEPDADQHWMLSPDDVARALTDALRYPRHALPSRIELRPRLTGP